LHEHQCEYEEDDPYEQFKMIKRYQDHYTSRNDAYQQKIEKSYSKKTAERLYSN
jgi:hypothetical protein